MDACGNNKKATTPMDWSHFKRKLNDDKDNRKTPKGTKDKRMTKNGVT